MSHWRSLFLSGFDAAIDRYHDSCEVCPGLPDVAIFGEVLLTPASRGDGSTRYRGAVFDSDDHRIESADLVREGVRVNGGGTEPAQARITGTGLYLGWLFPEYGHALLESLARCWPAAECDFAVYHAPRTTEVPSFLQAHLDRLGIPSTIIPTKPTRFERLLIPRPAFEIKKRAYRGFLEIFPGRQGTDNRPVYVSRSRLPPRQRAVAGEGLLERHLSDYRVVYPEKLSTAEQIEVFASHTTYVGMIGSAMHNILFNRSPEVVYLTDGPPNPNFLLCDELVEANSLYVGCCDLGGLPDLGRRMPLRLDLVRVAQALDVSMDPGLQARVDQRHREMWAEVRLKEAVGQRDPTAFDDLRRYYSGPKTPKLSQLEKRLTLALSTPASAGSRARRRSRFGLKALWNRARQNPE